MKTEKVEKHISDLHEKTEYVICIRNLKQALNNDLILKKVPNDIKYNQNAWVIPYIHMNTDLKNSKTLFLKRAFKLINSSVFGNTMGNVRKHRYIKLVTTEKRRNYLVSEPNYNTTNFFTGNLSAIEMKKTQIIMNKPVYFGL